MTIRAPILQKSWARPSPGSASTVTQRSTALLRGPQVMPIRQTDWPIPRPRPRIDYAQVVQRFRGFVVFVQPPLNQLHWPAALVAQQPFSSFASVNIALANGGAKPFAQYDWPLPARPYRIDYAQAVQRSVALVSVPHPMPFALYDWPRRHVYI